MNRDRSLLLAFGMTHCGKSLLWAGTDALSLYILIRIVQAPPVLAGELFVASSFWNAIIDGLWGQWLQRSPGMRSMLPGLCGVMAVLACAAFAMLPYVPAGAAVVAAGALIGFRTAYALLDVPHNATIAALAEVQGHLVIARWRATLSAATTIAIAIAAAPLISSDAPAARIMLLSIASLALVLLAPLPWLVRSAYDCTPSLSPPEEKEARPSHPAGLVQFCLVQMLGLAALASIGKALLHVTTLDSRLLGHVLLLLSLLRLAAAWLWSPIAARIGSPAALSCAYATSAFAVLLLPLAIVQGTVWVVLTLVLLGASVGGVGLLVWSSFSELLARLDLAGNRADAARSYGWFTASTKIGLGFSGLITGAWLAKRSSALAATSLWPLVILVACLCAMSGALGWPISVLLGRRTSRPSTQVEEIMS